jgi:hypothetical protein
LGVDGQKDKSGTLAPSLMVCQLARMQSGAVTTSAINAARAVAADRGIDCQEAEVVHAGSNVLVRLRPAPVLARVMTGTVVLHDDPRRWLEREVAVLRFLGRFEVAVRPSPLIAPGPYERDGLWLTCWEWLDHERQRELPAHAEGFARAMRELHHRLSAFSGALGDLRDVRDDIERLLGALQPTPSLPRGAIDDLRDRLHGFAGHAFTTALPVQPLHGDASLSNLLWTHRGWRWNDFEDVCRGPVHWDIAGFLSSLKSRGADQSFIDRWLAAYGGVDERELAPFLLAHDLYDEIWSQYTTQRGR